MLARLLRPGDPLRRAAVALLLHSYFVRHIPTTAKPLRPEQLRGLAGHDSAGGSACPLQRHFLAQATWPRLEIVTALELRAVRVCGPAHARLPGCARPRAGYPRLFIYRCAGRPCGP